MSQPESEDSAPPGQQDQDLLGNSYLNDHLQQAPTDTEQPDLLGTLGAGEGEQVGSPAPIGPDPSGAAVPGGVNALTEEEGMTQLGTGDKPPSKTTVGGVSQVTYQLTGATLGAVAKQIDKMGEAGRLTWNAPYTWSNTTRGRMYGVKVDLTREKRMPVWTNYAKRPKVAQTEWTRFYAALDVHEKGHAKLIKTELGSLAEDMHGQRVRAGKRMYRRRNAHMKREDAAYDARTKHGATQKAVLDGSKDP